MTGHDMINNDVPRPTLDWLAATAGFMPALDGPAGVAERLLLLVHYGIDWSNGWVSRYRTTYWDRLLPDRIVCATYRASNLRRWWRDLADDLGSQPRTAAERADLEQLLRADSRPVLEVLRFETEALLLRTRIVADAVRDARLDSHPINPAQTEHAQTEPAQTERAQTERAQLEHDQTGNDPTTAMAEVRG